MIEIKAGYIVELIDSKYLVHKCIVNYDNNNRLCFTTKDMERHAIGGYVEEIVKVVTPHGDKLFINGYKIIKVLGRASAFNINTVMYSDTREVLWSDTASIKEAEDNKIKSEDIINDII